MRELKFRAWDKDIAKYVDGVGELYADINEVGTKVFCIEQLCPGRYIFEQWTGLKDKNGKEIYEGDIVKARYDYMNGSYEWSTKQVVWDEEEGGFYVDLFHLLDYEYLEVIGNIHENPELIERSNN